MLLSERHQLLYELSVNTHRAARHAQWLIGSGQQADRDPRLVTPHRVARHSSLLLRKLGDVDMQLQHNKVRNLELAVPALDGRLLRPGESLSFWRCIGPPTARRGFLPGLVLVHGRMQSAVGGGLCQLSNLLHWLVLHTPLEVVERHHHGYDPFPDSGRVVPFGSGATVFFNYVDFGIRNPGPHNYRLGVWLTPRELCAELRSDGISQFSYHVREEGHRFFRRGGAIYRENRLYRDLYERTTGRRSGTELISHNVFPVLYEPGPGVEVEEELEPAA